MTDIRITNDGGGWDLALVDGDLELVPETATDDGEAVAQRLVFAWSTWLGESVYDRGAGVPYLDTVFGVAPMPGIAALLLQIGLDVEGVADIDGEPAFDLDSGRTLAIRAADGGPLTVVTANGARSDLTLEIVPV